MRAGDVVHHEESDETWLVASVSPDGTMLAIAGWPETIVEQSKVSLISKASDEKHQKVLLDVARSKSASTRSNWALENLILLHSLEEQELYKALRNSSKKAWEEYCASHTALSDFIGKLVKGEMLGVEEEKQLADAENREWSKDTRPSED